ncbi:unnamed protein product [Moneuplotes crassus]|uniref:Uncharacterized protein n=1 Tax=Euplotes crassus TaxID=5936 RepID=A0AAD1XT30_EUPCR|nr:unnamed protein product [Moneuplotes crassus]
MGSSSCCHRAKRQPPLSQDHQTTGRKSYEWVKAQERKNRMTEVSNGFDRKVALSEGVPLRKKDLRVWRKTEILRMDLSSRIGSPNYPYSHYKKSRKSTRMDCISPIKEDINEMETSQKALAAQPGPVDFL